MEKEIWKPVKGFENKYAVSNLGQVKSLARTRKCRVNGGTIALMNVPEKILKQWKRSSYNLVDFWIDGKRFVQSVHVLVYEAFNGEIKKGNFVHHKDENKLNNTPDNLEQMSVLEHNRIHFLGKPSWKKRLKTPKESHKKQGESHKKQWETRRKKYPTDERNKNIFNDKEKGLTLKELSAKYKLCTRQILTICKSLKEHDKC